MPIRPFSFVEIALVAIIAMSTSRSALPQSGLPRLDGPVRTFGGGQFESRVGTVTDVAIDALLNVYVLDGARGAVDVFRWDGSFLAEGSLDSGRNVAAKAIAVTPTGRVLVLPADGRTLWEFQLEGATLRRLSSYTISAPAGDVCVGPGSVFVIGFDSVSQSLVHQYGFDGRPSRNFGAGLAGNLTNTAAAVLQWRIA